MEEYIPLSESGRNKFDVNIDFTESSKIWRSNKKQNKNGTFIYKCNYLGCNRNPCKNGNIYNCMLANMNTNNSEIYCVKHLYKN